MTEPASCAIRRFHPSDLPALYRICLQTGFNGQDASDRVSDPDLIGHIYVGPYAVLDPLHAFVVTMGSDVVGYLVAAHHSTDFHARCEAEWFPLLRQRYPLPAADEATLTADFVRTLHRGHVVPRGVDLAAYPAHLHINLLASARGQGVGRKLMNHLFAALRQQQVPGVFLYAGAANTPALAFYDRMGFRRIEANETSVGYAYTVD